MFHWGWVSSKGYSACNMPATSQRPVGSLKQETNVQAQRRREICYLHKITRYPCRCLSWHCHWGLLYLRGTSHITPKPHSYHLSCFIYIFLCANSLFSLFIMKLDLFFYFVHFVYFFSIPFTLMHIT